MVSISSPVQFHLFLMAISHLYGSFVLLLGRYGISLLYTFICCSICDYYLGKILPELRKPLTCVFYTKYEEYDPTIYLKYSCQYLDLSLPSCLLAFIELGPWLSWIVELCPVSIKGGREAVRYKALQASTMLKGDAYWRGDASSV